MSIPQSLSDEIAAVVERVRPAVLHLRTMGRGQSGTGSGFLCGAAGLALTNCHVVQGALAVEATFHDGRTALVDVLGTDTTTDLALLRVPDQGTAPLVRQDSAPLRVGDFALAVGCPHGLSQSITAGIISGLGRALPGSGVDLLFPTVVQIEHPAKGPPAVRRFDLEQGLMLHGFVPRPAATRAARGGSR